MTSCQYSKMAAPVGRESCTGDNQNSYENQHFKHQVHRYNWLLGHPKYVEMKSWKLKNDEQIFITLVVYLNLCEAKDWWRVDIHPCSELNLAFITGKPKRKSDIRTVLPITSETQISPKRLQQFLSQIKLPQTTATTSDSTDDTDSTLYKDTPTSLTLAITEPGSTIVYYQISKGLVAPSEPPLIEDCEEEQTKHFVRHTKKCSKTGDIHKVKETITECVAEEKEEEDYRDDFMEEEL